ncbi:hypothetical protein SK128_000360, partial [Halocaridina rubra]
MINSCTVFLIYTSARKVPRTPGSVPHGPLRRVLISQGISIGASFASSNDRSQVSATSTRGVPTAPVTIPPGPHARVHIIQGVSIGATVTPSRFRSLAN